MGSVEKIPKHVSLETVVVWGPNLRDAMKRWGDVLRLYNGKDTNNSHNDYVSNFLGYWMDNGAYYYYNPLPNQTYEETVLEINDRMMKQNVSIRYVNYDSWFYEKGRNIILMAVLFDALSFSFCYWHWFINFSFFRKRSRCEIMDCVT